ncbi:DUF3368 domain-containing protein [Salinibacter ruber]|uniref:DUF3368 domain-containing protein n=1 Tax=Salinibacter ruber TaxID=146919 RepID=UPI003C6E6419
MRCTRPSWSRTRCSRRSAFNRTPLLGTYRRIRSILTFNGWKTGRDAQGGGGNDGGGRASGDCDRTRSGRRSRPDDERGRKEARRHGLNVTGATGVLIEAKERALISSMRSELDRLVEAGLWIDESLYDRVLREYGE